MSRVIKARSTRLLPSDARHDPPSSGEQDEADQPLFEDQDDSNAYQAAYDEVLEAAQQEISLLMEDARREAREIIAEADREASDIREQARAEGLEQGRADGYAGGFAQAGLELEDLFKRGQSEVDAVLAAAYAVRDQLLTDSEPQIKRLALSIAEKIIGKEMERDSEAFLSIVTTAINAIKCESHVTLHVNASEYMEVFGAQNTVTLQTDKGDLPVDILPDPPISPGGCLIETETGYVDASPPAQLEQIAFNLGIET